MRGRLGLGPDDHQGKPEEWHALDAGRALEETQAHVEGPGPDPLHQCRRTRIEQLNTQLRPLRPEFLDRLRQDVGGHQQSRTDRQCARVVTGGLSNARRGAFELFQASARDCEQLAAVRRQSDVSSRAIEEPESQLIFQLADQEAQCGWRDEQRLCGPGEAVMLCHEQERPELSRREIHS
jgi:hypothetical protein